DIADLREYERGRLGFRNEIIALKKKRRIPLGPVVTVLFENEATIRFQIQEMARAEKIFTDEGIQTELDIYNPLIPEPGHLAATLFVELTTDDQMREWLPKLVGIERSLVFRIGGGTEVDEVRCTVDADHEKQLTREEITAAVHYVHFSFTPEQVERFRAGPVALVIDHPAYGYETPLAPDTTAELLSDLTG
ncbi:MAG: uncharacterized protein JWM47_2184, partial [Acidimicrobiales bacterium]|nr:uncharacterized protein [Acidimicrobiales bacterium]